MVGNLRLTILYMCTKKRTTIITVNYNDDDEQQQQKQQTKEEDPGRCGSLHRRWPQLPIGAVETSAWVSAG